VKDLYDENGKALPFKKWVEKGLDKSSFLKWYGLINATRNLWNYVPKTDESTDYLTVQTHSGTINLSKIKMKDVYLTMVMRDRENNVMILKIAKWLPHQTIDWKNVYSRAHVKSVNVKTKEFQYKFLNDVLPTNYWLYKWKLRENDKCTFCKVDSENIEHLFFSCVHVQRLWRTIQIWYDNIEAAVFDKGTAFLGSDTSLLHTVVMTAKQYIFSCKCLENIPIFTGFYNRLNQVRMYELYGDEQNLNVNVKLIMKWAPIEFAHV
jgi:hypothetical protein